MHSKKIGTFFTAGLTHFFLVLFIKALPLYRQPWELAITLYLLSSRISGHAFWAYFRLAIFDLGRGFADPQAHAHHLEDAVACFQVTGRIEMARPGKIDIDDFLDHGGTIAHDENAIGKLHGFLNVVCDEENRFFALPDTDEIGRHFQANPTAGSIQLHRMPAVSLDIGGDQLFRLCFALSLPCEVKEIQNIGA